MTDPCRPLFLVPAVLALGVGLSACSGLLRSTQSAVQRYVLQLPAPAAAPGAASGPAAARPTLRIARPVPAPGLDTDRIALLRPGNRLDYYVGGRWSGPLAEVLSEQQVSAFGSDAAWSAVADERTGLNADYLLQTSIRQFAAEYTDAPAPQVRVALNCLLIRRVDGALLGSFAVSEMQQADANRMGSVVAAFSAATARALAAVVARSDQLISSAKAPAVP
jgi:ABC-type uncharacterized transport system auxiliary subunit